MAQVSRSKALLRITGQTLNPDEVSVLLGCKGSTMYSKGDVRKRAGREAERKFGHWSLRASQSEPECIDGQVMEILNKLNNNSEVWKQLANKYSIDMFCGIFMETSNEGMGISPKTLLELGSRGVMLVLDIYDGTE